MGCGPSKEAQVVVTKQSKDLHNPSNTGAVRTDSLSSAPSAAKPEHVSTEYNVALSDTKKSDFAQRRFSSGGESDSDSDGVIRASGSDEVFDLHSIRSSVHANGNLTGKVVRMETPFGKPIEEIYSGVHTGEVLGSGVSGTARLVTHNLTGVKYAVKCLDLGLIRSAEGLQQLREEIYIMCQLDHPNIVRLEEVYESFSEIYLVMELCMGGDLFDRLDEQPDLHYTEAKCAKLVKQMLSALRYLHSKKVIHRDLKLENFLFSSQGPEPVLKMIDFGLSKHFTFGVCETQAVGTPYTVAPEVIKGSYDEKCDIWAIGVIAYLLLSGETPFGGVDGEDLMQVRSNILRGSLKFEPAEVWNNVSELGKDFVRSALNLDPTSRPTAKEAQRHDWLQTYSKLPKDDPGSKLSPHVVNALVAFKEYSDMRKLLCEVVSFTLLPEQINDLRVEFEKIDNGKGEISLTDLKMVLLESARSVGGMSEREVEDVFNALRVRKTEPKIHWHEFIAAGLSQCKIDERNLKLAFDRIDIDRKGFITFDNVMDLVGDASENKDELKLMWMESAKHVQGELDRITVDDFLLIMKGQALGEQSETFRVDKRRPSRPLGIVIEGETSPQISRMTTEFGVFDTSSSGLHDHLMPHLSLGDTADYDVAIKPRRSLTVDTAAPGSDMRSYMKLRSRSLEHNKTTHFEGVDEDTEDESDELPQRPSVLLQPWSKKAIDSVRDDETKTSLKVNRAMYRAHRELRLAVMECSKRFEENRRRRELEANLQDLGRVQHPGPAIGLVMRRGYKNAKGLDGTTGQETDVVELEKHIAEQDALKKSAESEALLHASVRAGRPRTRKKTVSDMTGMFGPP